MTLDISLTLHVPELTTLGAQLMEQLAGIRQAVVQLGDRLTEAISMELQQIATHLDQAVTDEEKQAVIAEINTLADSLEAKVQSLVPDETGEPPVDPPPAG